MKLSELLKSVVEVSERDLELINDMDISSLALDSRAVRPGNLFIAITGANQHGLVHADEAINKGASAILFDPSGEGSRFAEKLTDIPAISVENLGVKLGELSGHFYGFPSQKLDVIGITGTNGKTSCSQFLGQVIDECGIIGTLGWGQWGQLNNTLNTTPDALTVQQILAQFVEEQKKAVAMEVSSHGLEQGRVNGVTFKGVVFTNISRDHLDYHGTMETYLAAKLKLMQMPALNFVVVNLDDASYEQVVAAAPESATIWGVSAKGHSINFGQSLMADHIACTPEGIEFNVRWNGKVQRIKSPLFGDFNAENVLCVLAVMLAMGQSLSEAATKLASIQPVTGRMERCDDLKSGLNVFVDYAHTPDALARVLASLRKHCRESLWVVFGCGGNRDTGKRPQMGSIAEQLADVVIITDDNPRFENNQDIAKEILSGCRTGKISLIQDRKKAIEHAITHAAPNDCIVIAGKGHEKYQEINGIKYPFYDKQVAEEALNNRFTRQ
jgi:UDP-N-acetylmuramoyl-L-alanyl-D-glutamate--2,6-diaminopimelate ligase